MPVDNPPPSTERSGEFLADRFFQRFHDLALRVRTRCGASESLMALGDALVASYQSRECCSQHLAQALLDPSRYEAVAHELEAFGERLANSAETPESLEFVICWLSYARLELLETLQADQAPGSPGDDPTATVASLSRHFG